MVYIKMASPRAAISMFTCLSPKKIHNVSTIRQTLCSKSPTNKLHQQDLNIKIPIKSLLKPENIYEQLQTSPRLKVDTPYKKRMINKGILGQHHTILGNGAFGRVYKACYKGKEVAAKIIKSNKRRSSSINMEKEVSFLRHLNIVQVFKVDEGPAMTIVTMELCNNSLQNILDENSITNKQRIQIWKSIAKALKYCHKMGIVHADVKPKNVLMGIDNQPKLADFGSAVFVNETQISSVFHGTPGYAAPEVVCSNKPTPLSDIYSLGVLSWQMLSRISPFTGLHEHTILYLTGKGVTPSDCDLEDNMEGQYKDLYRKSWSMRPNDRPSLLDIIEKLKCLENVVSEKSI